METINYWGICSFVLPVLTLISIGGIVTISSLLKGILKFLGGIKMTVQKMLEEAIKLFGLNDEVTVLLSQKRDKQIVEVQKINYENYKRSEYHGV